MSTNLDIPTTAEDLKALNPSNLWRIYTKLGLGITRSRKKTWLVEEIMKAQAATKTQTPIEDAAATPEPVTEEAPTEPTNDTTDAEAPTEAPTVTKAQDPTTAPEDNDASPAPEAPPTEAPTSDDSPTTEEPTDTANDEPTEAPDTLRLTEPAPEAAEPGAAPQPADTPTDTARPKLTKLTVDELRARYVTEVGRPTKSVNRGYLIWKIREARKGRVPVGAIARTKREPGTKIMVLPLRMAEPDVETLDAAWKRLGFKNRTAFLREAMETLLEARGEVEAAVMARG